MQYNRIHYETLRFHQLYPGGQGERGGGIVVMNLMMGEHVLMVKVRMEVRMCGGIASILTFGENSRFTRRVQAKT